MQVLKEDGTFLCNADVLKNFRKNIGLMFRRDMPDDKGLLLELNSAYLHSFFVFFQFHAIFLDRDMRIVDEFIMKPFTIKKVNARWVLEMKPGKSVRKGERLIIR
jgi:uncharacterized membrane protein (UPF0127 family)